MSNCWYKTVSWVVHFKGICELNCNVILPCQTFNSLSKIYYGLHTDCKRAHLPVHCDGSHRVYWWKHGSDGEEVLKSTVSQTKVPVVVKRIDKVKKGVKGCHGNVREGQVDNEVVCYGSHAPVSKDNPDHCDVTSDGHQDNEGVGNGPQSHLGGEERRR